MPRRRPDDILISQIQTGIVVNIEDESLRTSGSTGSNGQIFDTGLLQSFAQEKINECKTLVLYYGFIYGLFGCDNCRIQDSILSKPFNVLQDFGHSITVKETGLSKESIKEAINDEKDVTVNNTVIMSLINYGKSTIGRIVSTVAENIASLVSVYVGIKNIGSFVLFVLFGFWFTFCFNFLSNTNVDPDEAKEVVADAIGNPISIITDNVKNFLVIMLVVCIIKIASKLVITVLPKSVQNVIYEGSYKLNVKSQNTLNKMSDDNFNSDAYAQKYASPLIRAAHKGDVRWHDE